MGELKLIGFRGSLRLAKGIANHLNIPLYEAEERDFDPKRKILRFIKKQHR